MNQTHNTPNEQKASNKKVTSKQIVAIIGIILLVLLYVVTLIAAFIDTSASGRLFGACLCATFAVPVLIWFYTWMYGKLTGKSTMADLNIGGKDHVTDEEVREILIQQAINESEDTQ